MQFHIPETGRTVTAKQRPIVIITSNAEKELPDAFLRRCIFHYIAFPNQAMMTDIVHAHYDNIEENLLEMAMRAFYKVRDLPTVAKKPSTSELLDWLQALRLGGVDPEKIEEELPYAGILLKKTEDLTAVKNAKSRVKNGYRW
jgi:MoxR-like ATPase